jgi:glycosyltransferase involved in cell wall biosynthesis
MTEPTLSICVPSRNRQIFFQETIRALTDSLRPDVEFVLADNSDDPAVMDAFMAERSGDPRIRYLPAADRILPMMDNWERALCAATGRYVAFIGDDDYLDPDLAAFLGRLEAVVRPDAVAWTGPNYIWPSEGSPVRSVAVSLGRQVTRMPKAALMRKAFLWEGASHVPLSGFSIYHGALSRRLLDRIRAMGNGRYFEFPVIDYEMAFKAILLGETFIHSQRPFSVLGACPLSNSATIGKLAAERAAQRIFFAEHGWDMNHADWIADTPFRTWHGITACIYLIQHWLGHRIGVSQDGHEANLVRALAANCRLYRDRGDFETIVGELREALAVWKDGRYLADFEPRFVEPAPARTGPAFTGVATNGMLHFPDDTGGIRTPAALFDLIRSVVCATEEIPIDAATLWGGGVALRRASAA